MQQLKDPRMILAKTSMLTLITLSLIISSALAGPPVNGVFNSTDLGGEVEVGRYMESYTDPDGAISIGTTLFAQSWDGMSLGTQWSYQCGVVESDPILISDFVGAGPEAALTRRHSWVVQSG